MYRILSVFMLLLLFQCQNNDSNLHLSGEIKSQSVKPIVISYASFDGEGRMHDTIDIIDGKFNFIAKIRTPTKVILYHDSPYADDPNYFQFFAEPKKMSIILKENKFKSAKVTGSKTQLEYEDLHEITKNEYEKAAMQRLKRDNLLKRYNYGNMDSIGAIQMSNIQNEWAYHLDQIKATRVKYIVSKPNSYLGPYYLSEYYFNKLPLDTIENLYNGFSEEVKVSYYGNYLKSMIKSAKTPLKVGDYAADFSLDDMNGQSMNLKSFRGKYVILDFWASWCGPCRKQTPQIIDFYKRHKKKGIEVIGLSRDKDKKAWLNAVKEDGSAIWHHAFLNKNEYEIIGKYDIEYLPTYILINPEGIIVGRFYNFKDLSIMMTNEIFI